MLLKPVRWDEYRVFIYRLCLVYVFYTIARILFYFFNADLIKVDGILTFLSLCYHGLAFDTVSILVVNLPFILLSLLPLMYTNTSRWYQGLLFIVYIVPNVVAYITNFVDFIFYPYNFGRFVMSLKDSIVHENNEGVLLVEYIQTYWYIFLLFFTVVGFWIYLYTRIKVKWYFIKDRKKYMVSSALVILIATVCCIVGIRGTWDPTSPAIRVVDAGKYTKHLIQADLVLNTPFTMLKTFNQKGYQKMSFVDDAVIDSLIVPIKTYPQRTLTKPNIVIFILESNSREYYGCFNRDNHIPHFQSYTPFFDSLAEHSLLFTNAYSNGNKSIHAVPSVLAGIPSFTNPFCFSSYDQQPTESLVSTLESIGYTTSFFHGGSNLSMGFHDYANILGVDRYYGRTEYNNEKDFDGFWGIWDEPFFQYVNKTMGQQQQPFLSTIFSLSSHDPYIVPEQYKGKFPKGTIRIHQCIGYTDYALRQFFEKAKHQAWFKNTLFWFVGDHGNKIYYDEYKKEMNKNAVMMMMYDPSGQYVGVHKEVAQQIDIYPTTLDIIGYPSSFRSWGISLLSEGSVPPFMIRYSSNRYQMLCGNYICVFSDGSAVGFYHKDDKDLEHNLIRHRTPAMDSVELRCKAFLQDYMARVIDRKLSGQSNQRH